MYLQAQKSLAALICLAAFAQASGRGVRRPRHGQPSAAAHGRGATR